MAIISIRSTDGALPPEARARLAVEVSRRVYEAEGFADSTLAPSLCWVFFDDRPRGFLTGAGTEDGLLVYVEVTTLAHALDRSAKPALGADLTRLLEAQGPAAGPGRVWVRFKEVADGDLFVGGEATSLAGLRALVAADAGRA